jgi:hypothetical protein
MRTREEGHRYRVIRYPISGRACSQAKRAASKTAPVKFREEARVPATQVCIRYKYRLVPANSRARSQVGPADKPKT